MDILKTYAFDMLLAIENMKNTFYKENGFFPNAIKMNKDCLKLIIKYNESIIMNFEVGNPKTIFGMEIEEIEEKYIHVYKKGC